MAIECLITQLRKLFERSSNYEYFHHFVRDSVGGMDFRFRCVPRGRWIDPHSADRGPDFAGAALRSRAACGLNLGWLAWEIKSAKPDLRLNSACINSSGNATRGQSEGGCP